MEGTTGFDGISFEQTFSVPAEAPVYKKVIFNTLNWLETNRQGMTFGILFAAAIMLLFSLLENWKSKHPLVNAVAGMFIGFPMGVCVNCAAPIARGVYKGGGKVETALSMMISSPTLNVVVLTMTFSMFPFYMAMLKVLLSLAVVLIGVPVITHFVYKQKKILATDALDEDFNKKSITPFQAEFKETVPTKSLSEALIWFVRSYWKRLWYIIKTTVPLMLLAGIFGNILIHYVPWEVLADVGLGNSLVITLLIVLLVAVVGLLLPIPMAFDIIIVTVLMATGLPPLFGMVLLFTLGSFSVYSFFIVWQTFNLRLALSLSLFIVLLGMGGGIIAHKLSEKNAIERLELFRSALTNPNPKPPEQLYFASKQPVLSYDSILSSIKDQVQKPSVFKTVPEKGITIKSIPFNKSSQSNEGIVFKKITGKEIGLSVDVGFDLKNEFSQISQSSSISAGDIQNDGWQDVIMANMNDLYLFFNTGNGNYLRQSFSIPALEGKSILTTVLLDLNNDDWLDVFIGTYQEGNYALLSNEGDLTKGEVISLANNGKTTFTLAPAFADVDRNSTIDIYSGNWSIGMMGDRKRGFKSSINYLMTDPLKDSTRKVIPLNGTEGETLTTMFSDFNNDGIQDLIVGNDFKMPELFYHGIGNGEFQLITTVDSIIPITTQNTMSIDGVDLNNDLVYEYFMAGSASKDLPHSTFKAADSKICNELDDPEERKQCEQIMRLHEKIGKFRSTKEINYCPEGYEEDCIVLDMLSETVRFLEGTTNTKSRLCDFIPSNEDWSFMKGICEFDRTDTVGYSSEEELDFIPSIRNRSVLLKRQSELAYENLAEEFNLGITGWSWNAQFADFDNDQFSDLFIATGSFHETKREPNHLYKNVEGETFVEISDETGMNSYLSSYTYVYTDFDNDGDLDIIMPPALAPIQFYENQSTANNSLVIELKDSKGNKQGVGSKVTVTYGKDGKQQVREMKASGGYRSFNPIEAWFGLGTFETVNEISIEWSTGEKQVLEGPFPAGNRFIIYRNL